jgi:hypothetical protein
MQRIVGGGDFSKTRRTRNEIGTDVADLEQVVPRERTCSALILRLAVIGSLAAVLACLRRVSPRAQTVQARRPHMRPLLAARRQMVARTTRLSHRARGLLAVRTASAHVAVLMAVCGNWSKGPFSQAGAVDPVPFAIS